MGRIGRPVALRAPPLHGISALCPSHKPHDEQHRQLPAWLMFFLLDADAVSLEVYGRRTNASLIVIRLHSACHILAVSVASLLLAVYLQLPKPRQSALIQFKHLLFWHLRRRPPPELLM